jgi:F-type H+-transporting ATPase subunit b
MTNLLKSFLRPLVAAMALAAILALSPSTASAQDGHSAPAAAAQHAGEGHAAGGHDETPAGVIPTTGQGIMPAFVSLIVFSIVLAVLSVKVWPTISKGLNDRANKIREEIAAAEAARKQAKDALDMYERSLADARAEAQKMLEKTKAQQQALAEELKAKADADLTAMRERAKRDIESAKRAALAEIYTQSATVATSIAAKILQREVNSGDQQRLIDQSVRELEAAQG